jgi:hypothetical protein
MNGRQPALFAAIKREGIRQVGYAHDTAYALLIETAQAFDERVATPPALSGSSSGTASRTCGTAGAGATREFA